MTRAEVEAYGRACAKHVMWVAGYGEDLDHLRLDHILESVPLPASPGSQGHYAIGRSPEGHAAAIERDGYTVLQLDVGTARNEEEVEAIVARLNSPSSPVSAPTCEGPTGPGWYWGHWRSFDCPDPRWIMVEVYAIGQGFRVVGHDEDDFDAWVGPLTPPDATTAPTEGE